MELVKKSEVLVAAVIAVVMFLVSFSFAAAHGAGGSWKVDAEDKNCMGQLARMHAQDERHGTNGLPASFAESTHNGFGLGRDKGDSVHDTMHAFKAYCNAE